ncbi:hypothetical protein Y029_5703 [Burkholderia pseudomallei MSHR303]|nr:hypothetical protein BGI49_23530 [Burkholderia pseudomallei]KGS35307.1 hypothetical protein X945_5850 [Burkholderia pseudomallei ABCPW 107]KGW58400.1 hypothetical protein Y029_5703 [Burkholderia pseudomallei MSHR303]APZ15577.1 hypothetical protein BGI52_23630 [Burkholderia pseudomallei]APZ21748.1 hypothetical protein BGI47_24170 [Burkholderia pseudomallei]
MSRIRIVVVNFTTLQKAQITINLILKKIQMLDLSDTPFKMIGNTEPRDSFFRIYANYVNYIGFKD